jgi:hypothetical protein
MRSRASALFAKKGRGTLKEEPAWGSCAMRKEKSLDGEGDMMPLSH